MRQGRRISATQTNKGILRERRICQGRTWPRNWRRRSRSRRRNARRAASSHSRSRGNPCQIATPAAVSETKPEQNQQLRGLHGDHSRHWRNSKNFSCNIIGFTIRSGSYLISRMLSWRLRSCGSGKCVQRKKKPRKRRTRESVKREVVIATEKHKCWEGLFLFFFFFQLIVFTTFCIAPVPREIF